MVEIIKELLRGLTIIVTIVKFVVWNIGGILFEDRLLMYWDVQCIFIFREKRNWVVIFLHGMTHIKPWYTKIWNLGLGNKLYWTVNSLKENVTNYLIRCQILTKINGRVECQWNRYLFFFQNLMLTVHLICTSCFFFNLGFSFNTVAVFLLQ